MALDNTKLSMGCVQPVVCEANWPIIMYHYEATFQNNTWILYYFEMCNLLLVLRLIHIVFDLCASKKSN